MNHSAIARVFDAGVTVEGTPYFAMEYVEGTALVEHCDRERLSIAAAASALRRGLRRGSARAPEGDHPPRPQVCQRSGRRGKRPARTEDHRLRHRQGPRRAADSRGARDAARPGGRHARLHVARAARLGRAGRRHAERRLRPGGPALRNACRSPAVRCLGAAPREPRRGGARAADAGPTGSERAAGVARRRRGRGRARARHRAARAGPRDPRRSRRHRPPCAREGARAALPGRVRAGGGCPAPPGGRAGPGAFARRATTGSAVSRAGTRPGVGATIVATVALVAGSVAAGVGLVRARARRARGCGGGGTGQEGSEDEDGGHEVPRRGFPPGRAGPGPGGHDHGPRDPRPAGGRHPQSR